LNWTKSIIARLDGKSFEWTIVGDLNVGRHAHNAIYLNGYFIVVGGYGERYQWYKGITTEKCVYNNNQMTCTSQSPSLINYAYTPELMVVYDDYCN